MKKFIVNYQVFENKTLLTPNIENQDFDLPIFDSFYKEQVRLRLMEIYNKKPTKQNIEISIISAIEVNG